jgi:hypothetical protein
MLSASMEGDMNKVEAETERARLQKLLDAYEAGRRTHQDEDARRELRRDATPDRANNVRARIARLEQILAEPDDA